jgi:hypothetical protein
MKNYISFYVNYLLIFQGNGLCALLRRHPL